MRPKLKREVKKLQEQGVELCHIIKKEMLLGRHEISRYTKRPYSRNRKKSTCEMLKYYVLLYSLGHEW